MYSICNQFSKINRQAHLFYLQNLLTRHPRTILFKRFFSTRLHSIPYQSRNYSTSLIPAYHYFPIFIQSSEFTTKNDLNDIKSLPAAFLRNCQYILVDRSIQFNVMKIRKHFVDFSSQPCQVKPAQCLTKCKLFIGQFHFTPLIPLIAVSQSIMM